MFTETLRRLYQNYNMLFIFGINYNKFYCRNISGFLNSSDNKFYYRHLARIVFECELDLFFISRQYFRLNGSN